MRRAWPFVIIALVALVTVGIATAVYRVKTAPAPMTAATPKPAPVSRTASPAAAESASAETASSEPTTAPTAAAEEKEDASLHVRGPADAPVTLEIYGDFQCPSCATTSKAISALEKEYEGRVRVIFHEFPLAMHAHAAEAAMAAEAAGLQGRFWEMHDMLYQYQSSWSKFSDPGRLFAAYADSIGLDPVRFQLDARSSAIKARVMADGEAGAARGVKNTPTLFLNGREARNTFTQEQIKEAIDRVLAEAKKS